jgi:hypothetical protein
MRYHGKRGQVKIGATVVASLNSWTLNSATDKADVTAFGDSNKQYVTGLPDVKGSLAGWFDDAEEALFLAAEGDAPVALDLFPVSTLTGTHWNGQAYLDANVECPATGPITVSGDWVAAGPWTRTWTPPIVATGATAGTPGSFTPAGAVAPANLAAMTGITASPATAWTTGQHVILGDNSHCHWDSAAWAAGDAP